MAISSKISTPTNPSTQAVPCLPPLGQIPLNPAKVAGCHEQDLVHGNVIRTINGDSTYKLCKGGPEGAGNSYLAIEGDEHHITNGNLDNYVAGDTNDTRVGVHNQTNMSPRNDTFMHTRAEFHHEPENRQQLTQDNNITVKENRFWVNLWEQHGVKFTMSAATIGLTGIEAQYKTLASRTINWKMDNEPIKVKVGGTEVSLIGLATHIKGCAVKAAASHNKLIALDINGGNAVNGDSPAG
jgi:hypothetical protein